MVSAAIFLGAGASKAERCTPTRGIVPELFLSDLFRNSFDVMDRAGTLFLVDVSN
jgi:hypothetical protein